MKKIVVYYIQLKEKTKVLAVKTHNNSRDRWRIKMQQKANGLYDPRFEHDNCGIGAVVNIKGNKDHEAVEGALGIVEHLEHRAGKDAEGGYSPALRMSGEQKYKEGDGPAFHWESDTGAELLLFTSRQQCYKTFVRDFDDTKASALGDYLPAKLEMEEGESILWACLAGDYTGHLLFFFANGKAARVPLASYQTVTRRKKLTGAYSDKSPLKDVLFLPEGQEEEVVLYSTEGRALLLQTDGIPVKTTRSTQGVQVMTLKKTNTVDHVAPLAQTAIVNQARYRARSLPAAGALLKPEDRGETQISLL